VRIVVDLDGTICELRRDGQTYADVIPLPGATEKLRQLKHEGHTIIVYTARNMRSAHGNIGVATANVGKMTLEWLDRYGIPYDEVVFGKPYGDIYIDDLGYCFESWDDVVERIRMLPDSV